MTYRARAVVGVLRAYQRVLSPTLGSRCRYYPSCSEYAVQAVELHGPARGLYLGLRRVGRCHPLRPGGSDEVPQRFTWRVSRRVGT